jgi:predicted Ser/Thr protein kinase
MRREEETCRKMAQGPEQHTKQVRVVALFVEKGYAEQKAKVVKRSDLGVRQS